MTTVKFPAFTAEHKNEQHCGSYLLQVEVLLSDIVLISKTHLLLLSSA